MPRHLGSTVLSSGETYRPGSMVNTMAHSLGLNVVAEGVELEEQMEFLRAHGCDEIQGYWLAKPLEADACLAFIKQWQPPQSVRAAF